MSNYKLIPFPLAMVLCDFIHRDPGTGKCTLIGTFSTIGAKQFPNIHPLFCLYVALTDGRGDLRVRVDLVKLDAAGDSTIFESESLVVFEDPLAILELGFFLEKVTFDTEGEYRIRLHVENEFLLERRLIAMAK